MHHTFKLARLSAAISTLLLAGAAEAAVTYQDYTANLSFQSLDQSMWRAGQGASLDWKYFSGPQWGSYVTPGQNKVMDLGALGGISSSGRVGIETSFKSYGGTLDATVPVEFSVKAPTGMVAQGERFTVQGSATVKNSQLVDHPIGFNFGVKGVFQTDTLIWAGLDSGKGTSINIDKQFDILGLNIPSSKPFSLGGNEFTVPILNKPFEIKPKMFPYGNPAWGSIRPKLGELTFFTTNDSVISGNSGDGVSLNSRAPLLKLTASVEGLLTNIAQVPVGVLSNSASIKGVVSVGYVLSDTEVGVQASLLQDFKMNSKGRQWLEFSGAVSEHKTIQAKLYQQGACKDGLEFLCELAGPPVQIEILPGQANECETGPYSCSFVRDFKKEVTVRHQDGRFEVQEGQETSLSFADGAGWLKRRFFDVDSTLTSKTFLETSFAGSYKMGCMQASLIFVGEFNECAIRESWNIPGYTPELYSNTFNFGDFAAVSIDSAMPVPEPGSWALMLAGLSALVGLGRRRRGQQARL